MSQRAVGAGFLAAAWVGIAVLVLERVAPSPEWRGPEVLGVSCAFLLYRMLVWGLLPALVASRKPLHKVGGLVLGIDIALLGGSFIASALAGIALAFAPAQQFSRWTRERSHLSARVAMHFVYFTTLLVWVVPAMVLELDGRTFTLAPLTWIDELALQLAVLPGIVGIAATLEFRDRGRGTPMPYDPPLDLVVTGPFAYVANPFQITKVALLFGLGLFLESGHVVLAGVFVLLYGVTITRWREDRDLPARFGNGWHEYRAHVRRWIPRWRPWRHPSRPSAMFYLDGECAQCRQLAGFFSSATGLEIVLAGDGITRITYDPGDGGSTERGVAAIARALEHIHLGWAFIGWSMRVPILSSLFELIADVVTHAPEPAACQSTMTVSVGERIS